MNQWTISQPKGTQITLVSLIFADIFFARNLFHSNLPIEASCRGIDLRKSRPAEICQFANLPIHQSTNSPIHQFTPEVPTSLGAFENPPIPIITGFFGETVCSTYPAMGTRIKPIVRIFADLFEQEINNF